MPAVFDGVTMARVCRTSSPPLVDSRQCGRSSSGRKCVSGCCPARPHRITHRGLLESEPPHREVFLETMEDVDGPPSHNVQTLTPADGGTLLVLVITYENREQRDM